MNPKPFSSLNHFTVPVAIVFPPASVVLRTRRLLSKGYERWHCDVGQSTQPDALTLAAARSAPCLAPKHRIHRAAASWRGQARAPAGGAGGFVVLGRERTRLNFS